MEQKKHASFVDKKLFVANLKKLNTNSTSKLVGI